MSERTVRFLERAQRREVVLKVYAIVVAETVWVLQSFYGYSRAEISEALIPLLEEHGLQVEEGRATIQALTSTAAANIGFADVPLAERVRMRGEGVASFDRDFEKLGVECCKELPIAVCNDIGPPSLPLLGTGVPGDPMHYLSLSRVSVTEVAQLQ